MSWQKISTVLAATMLLAAACSAQSRARIVRLSFLSGEVEMDRNTGAGFEKAILNMPVTEGVKLATGENALAEVEFEDGSSLRLAPETRVEFPQLQLLEQGGKASKVQVDQGTAYFNVSPKGGDQFQIRFADRQIELEKSAHFRVDVSPTQVNVAVFKGEVNVNGPDALIAVKKHESVTLYEGNSGNYELAKSLATDRWDSWDAERINYQNEYAKRDGYGDLSYYGSWTNYAGYGRLWRPNGVGLGWDPFYSGGYWAYYPSYGYMWVSSYPWGFTPYHYGRWVYLANAGWYWWPGQNYYGSGWYGYPQYVNAPGGWVAPKPPATPPSSGGPTTVIVNNGGPLPPRGPLRRTPGTKDKAGDEMLPAGDSSTVAPAGGRANGGGRWSTAPGSSWPATTRTAPPSGVATVPPGARETPAARPPEVQRGPRNDAGGRWGTADTARPQISRPSPAPRMSAPPAPRMSAPPAPRSSTPHFSTAPAPRMPSPPRSSSTPHRTPH